MKKILALGILLSLTLISYGKDLDEALFNAVSNGNLKEVKTLIEKKVDINIQDKDGYTALMYATQNNSTDIVELLANATSSPTPQVGTRHRRADAQTCTQSGAEGDSFQKNKEKIIKANNFYGYKGEVEMYISYYESGYSVFGDSGKNNVGKTYKGYLESVLDEENQKIIFYENDYVKELRLEKKDNNNLIFYDKKKVYDSKQNSDDDFNNLAEKYPMHKYPESVLSFLYYDSSFPQYFVDTDVFLSSFLEGYFEYYLDEMGSEGELVLDDDYRVILFYVGDYSIDYMWRNNVPYEIEIYTGAEVITITFLDEKGWIRR